MGKWGISNRLHRSLHFPGTRITPIRLLLHRPDHDLINPLINGDSLRWRVENARRNFSAEHLVKHHAQTINIRSVIDPNPLLLLGSHVVRRPKDHPRHRLPPLLRCLRTIHPRQSEVRHFDSALRVHQNVRGLNIPMNHALGMRILQSLTHPNNDFQRLRRLKRRRLNQMMKRRSLNKLHDEVKVPLGSFTKVKDQNNVRVVHLRHRLGLPDKPIAKISINTHL